MVKTLLATPESHIRVRGRGPSSLLRAPAVAAQIFRSLPHPWETQVQLQAPGFSLVRPWLLWAHRERTSR